MSEERKKDWERPWSTEEIVEHADNWNLACDAALLNTLKAFGDKILNKSDEVYKKVDNLCDNLDKASLRVDLARNEFNSLRNSQFVECRVYEEDETLLNEQKSEKKDENDVPKVETVEDLREAVALGLHILDEYYDKVEVTVSDSEDEEEEMPSYVYRRKDLYVNRPLPYVIGSEEWYKKWHVGLQESSDSENEKSASEKFSDSESEDDLQIKDKSDASSELSNLSGLNNTKEQPVAVSTANTTQSNDFLASVNGSDSLAAPPVRPSSFAEQLAAKLGNVIKENQSLLEDPSVNRRPIQKKPSDYGALFLDEPPPLDDNEEDNASHGIFSGGKGLFDDDDEDDALWNPGKSDISSNSHLGSDISKLENSSRSVKSKGLFDEDSDDDIFSTLQKSRINPQIKQPYLQPSKPAIPILNEEPPVVEEEKIVKEKKKPAGGVSIFGKTDIFQNKKIVDILKPTTKSSSEESNGDVTPPKIIEENPKPISTTVSNSNETTVTSKKIQNKNLDSNKQTISEVPNPVEPNEVKGIVKKNDSLFEDEEPNIFDTEKPKSNKKSLFDDDIFGEDLFSDVENKYTSNLFSKEDLFSEKEITESSESRMKPSKNEDELFRNVDQPPNIKNEYDYSWRKNSKSKIDSLFDDIEDDFDIFQPKKMEGIDTGISNKGQESMGNEKDGINKNNTSKISLFDDEFEDVDDLFSEILNTDRKQTKKIMSESNNENKAIEKPFTKELPKVQPVSSKKKGEPKNFNISKEQTDISEPTKEKSADIHVVTENVRLEENMNNELENPVKESKYLQQDKTSICSTGEESSSNETVGIDRPSSKSVPPDLDTVVIEPRSSLSVPHLSFMDSVPPPDYEWENAVDNTFDDPDPYSYDGFQSEPSSLFDNEPPSLFFNDTSGIMRDHADNRLDSVNSFDPSLTSSRRLSSDIFRDTENNDSLFLTKNQDGPSIPSQSNLQSVPEISDYHSDDITDLTPSGNPYDLYSSMTVDVTEEINASSVDNKSNESNRSLGAHGEESSSLKGNDDSGDLPDLLNDNEACLTKPKITKKPPISKIKPKIDKSRSEKSSKDKVSDQAFIDYANETKVIDETSVVKIEDISADNNASSRVRTETMKEPISLLNDIFDRDETDDLFPTASQTDLSLDDDLKIRNAVISDKVIGEKRVSFDKNTKRDDGRTSEESDEMQNNISRIAEKLQQISNKNEERPKNIAIPRKLSHNLNINVGALLPGSAPPKKDKLQSPEEKPESDYLLSKSLPASRFSPESIKAEGPSFSRKPIPILRTVSESDSSRKEYKLEKSISFDSCTEVEILQSVTKDRARIPVKRRPSSRRARQESLRNSIPDFKILADSGSDVDQMPKDLAPSQSGDGTPIENTETSTDAASQEKNVGNTIETPSETKKSTQSVPVSLFDSVDDEEEDLFKTIRKDVKSVNQAKIISTRKKENLFDEDEDGSTQNEVVSTVKEIDKSIEQKLDDLFGKTEIAADDLFSEGKVSDHMKKDVEVPTNTSDNDMFSRKKDKKKSINILFDSSDDSDDFLKSANVKNSTLKNEKTVEKPPISIIGKIADKPVEARQSETTKNLFDSSDDDDFLESIGSGKIMKKEKTPSKKPAIAAKPRGSSLFDDDNDDDIFGTSSSSNKIKQDTQPSVISKKIPKSSGLRKMENIEADEDPLSALLK